MKNFMILEAGNQLQAAIIAAGLKTTQDLRDEALEETKKIETAYREASRKMCQNPSAENIERYQQLRKRVSPKLWARF